MAALGSLAGRWGNLVWELVFSELKGVTEEPERAGGSVEAGQHAVDDDAEEDEVNEKERSWRDPSAHKFRVAVGHWLDEEYHRDAFVKVTLLALLSFWVMLTLFVK
jgi:U3 small nucleolar RNA-associated protein 20